MLRYRTYICIPSCSDSSTCSQAYRAQFALAGSAAVLFNIYRSSISHIHIYIIPTMCSGNEQDLHNPQRFGALAILKPSASLTKDNPSLSGQIVFFNEMDYNSPMATHVSLTHIGTDACRGDLVFTILCVILHFTLTICGFFPPTKVPFMLSSTGDLTIPSAQCTHFNRFKLPDIPKKDSSYGGTTQSKLAKDLLIQVGGDGIIGRRVSVSFSDSPSICLAEGIVGFNTGAVLTSPANV